jgi:hypothetical protein
MARMWSMLIAQSLLEYGALGSAKETASNAVQTVDRFVRGVPREWWIAWGANICVERLFTRRRPYP